MRFIIEIMQVSHRAGCYTAGVRHWQQFGYCGGVDHEEPPDADQLFAGLAGVRRSVDRHAGDAV